VCLLWGTTYLAIRVAVATWEPFLFGGLRFAAAGTIVILAMRLRGIRVPPDARLLRDAAIAGTLLLVGGNSAVILAERYVPSGITAVMVSTMPIWTVVISALTPRGHRFGPLNWIGLLAGLAGVVVLVWPELAGPLPANRQFLWGVVMLQLGSISWAAGSVYVVSRRAMVPPLLGAGLQMLAGGIVMLLIGTLFGEWARLRIAAGIRRVRVRAPAPAGGEGIALRIRESDRGGHRWRVDSRRAFRHPGSDGHRDCVGGCGARASWRERPA
jgi:drug/metabolite transporter (DMT)-like permease